jgi:hypothetical protein
LPGEARTAPGGPRAAPAAEELPIQPHDAGGHDKRRGAARARLVDRELVSLVHAFHVSQGQQTACRKRRPISQGRSEERAGGAGLQAHENGKPRLLTRREAADIAGELTEDDLAARTLSVCVKWVADEAETLTEASLMLRDYAEWLLVLELDGWQLVDPVDGGHGILVNEDPEKRLSEPA